jgi:hypothetical protein
MAQGGDWRAFRDEIASLHVQATTEEEYVSLLEAFHLLVLMGEEVYDAETWAALEPITRSEYRNFLHREALGPDGLINPALLGSITLREIEAGRLADDDEFAELAAAGAAVFGDSRLVAAPRTKRGDWFFYGMASASVLAALLTRSGVPLWLIAVGLLVGWYVNDREISQIKKDIKASGFRDHHDAP